ncbi:trehalose-phosphate phosphatase A [Chlorella sorokiniana]|uniref:Trehalose 6-phosphate phosphatase n=1 Tax=Chlorella sorokiniana TaxID=3076 RepID=A0A2P6U3P8_CHLSO|nr:trehalose-phosphate phosphatase A [Chlorella sorokiniana]|eukprot:PRW60926.1 trehalose-phosphate phosphatase A [Chlorella sorokiniana]
MDGAHTLRQAALVSRVSFEPLSMLEQNGLTRDGSGVSAQSDSEFEAWREEHPCALHSFDQIAALAANKLVAVFLDYDGTLTPIVSNPDLALMSDHARAAVRRVAQLFPTAIISGRGREKVQQFVQLAELYYAGSHGMDIVGPDVEGTPHADLAFQPAAQYEPLMDAVYEELAAGVAQIAGSSVEHNKFCVSVHFRNCDPDDYPAVVGVVEAVAAAHPELRVTRGRKVLEVRPQVDWDKGTALAHLLELLGLADPDRVVCLYIGDDRTDEDAFKVLAERRLGGGILVSTKPKPTAALWTLRDPAEVAAFLNRLVAWGQTNDNLWHSVGSCTGWAMCPSMRRRSQEATLQARAAVACPAPAGCNVTDSSSAGRGAR